MTAPALHPFTAQPGVWPAALGAAAGQIDAAKHRHAGIYPLSGDALHQQAHETWMEFLEGTDEEMPGPDWHRPFEQGYHAGYTDQVH